MIQAIGNASGLSIDAEYLRIIQELRRLGLQPTGDKNNDAQRLAQAKAQLVQKIQKQDETNSIKSLGVQIINSVNETYISEHTEMETQRLGAMTVAELNKLYFRL